MRCMNMPSTWDGWSTSEANVTKLIFEEYLINDSARGEAGAKEALIAYRKLAKDTAGDEDGGMYAAWTFSAEYRGYTTDKNGQLIPPQPGHGDR
jgi:hypothetical protein